MSRGIVHNFLSVAICLLAATASAADPSALIPGEAGVVIRFQKPNSTLEQIANLANAVQPGIGTFVLAAGPSMTGPMISNPELAGVDSNQDWWIAVFFSADAEPAMAFVIPTTDASAMEEALGDEVAIFKQEGWTAYCDKSRDDVVTLLKARIDGKGKALELGTAGQPLFERAGLAAHINLPTLLEIYGPQMEQGIAGIREQLSAIPASAVPGMNVSAITDLYGGWLDNAVQLAKDGKSVTAGLTISPEVGLEFEKIFQAQSGSPTAEKLSKLPTSDLNSIQELPSGQALYFGMRTDMPALMDWAQQITEKLYAGTENEQLLKQTSEALTVAKKIPFGDVAYSMQVDPNAKDGLVKYTGVLHTSEPTKYQELMNNVLSKMKEINAAGMKQKVSYKPKAEKVEQSAVDVIKMEYEFTDPDSPEAKVQKPLLDAMYGGQAVESRVAYLKDRVVITVGGGSAALATALKPPTAASSAVATARQTLPTQANFVMLMDLAQFIPMSLKISAASNPAMQLPINVEKMQKLKLDPSYTSVAVTTHDDVIHFKTSIPTVQMKSLQKLYTASQSPPEKPSTDKPGTEKPRKNKTDKTKKKVKI